MRTEHTPRRSRELNRPELDSLDVELSEFLAALDAADTTEIQALTAETADAVLGEQPR